MTERRRYARHRLAFPIRLDSKRKTGRIGMCRNGSISGLLLGTPSRFRLGERLLLAFRVSERHQQEKQLQGTIVRVEEDTPDSWFNRLVAVELDAPDPELDALFVAEARRQARTFGACESSPGVA